MAYSDSVRKTVANAPVGLGGQLGRAAVKKEFSVPRIAKATGATRQTVYNWFGGGAVMWAYRERVQQLIDILYASDTADNAWRRVCTRFGIRA